MRPWCLALLALSWSCNCNCNCNTVPTPTVPQTYQGFRMLTDGAYHAGPVLPAWGFYVLGTVKNGEFVPMGEVLGRGEIGESGTFGWMELLDGSFHPAAPTAQAPEKPYVPGYLSPDGTFAPSSQKVVR